MPDAEEMSSPVGFDALYQQAQTDIEQRTKRAREERERRKQELAQETGDPEALRRKLDLDMRFVTTRRHGQPEPYLPGSGLKGILRTRCEQLARTFLPDQTSVCDIFGEASCTRRLPDYDAAARYAAACRICQVFGCGALAGRLAISDGYLLPEPIPRWGTRSGVGIDRRRGAAYPGALFFYEVLERGAFELTLTLENFELWQVGLVGLALHDLWTGALPIGFGTRRGLGRVQGRIHTAELTYFGTNAYAQGTGCQLKGVAALTTGREGSERYRFAPEPVQTRLLPGATLSKKGLRQCWSLPLAAQEALWEAGVTAWQGLMTPPAPVGEETP
jgi:CRISPR/Cas system CSM-associated protein Csm3 (group 7 of RAMP superfamily)